MLKLSSFLLFLLICFPRIALSQSQKTFSLFLVGDIGSFDKKNQQHQNFLDEIVAQQCEAAQTSCRLSGWIVGLRNHSRTRQTAPGTKALETWGSRTEHQTDSAHRFHAGISRAAIIILPKTADGGVYGKLHMRAHQEQRPSDGKTIQGLPG